MTIYEQVATALTGLGVTCVSGMYTQASPTAPLPDTFVVYTLVSGIGSQHAEDVETLRAYRVQLSIYSRLGLQSLPDVDTKMVAAGFAKGPEREMPFDQNTRHYGLVKEFVILV